MSSYRRVLRYAFQEWPRLSLIAALAIAAALLAALQPWPLKLLVDYGLQASDVPVAIRSVLEAVGFSGTPVAWIVLAAAASLVVFVVTSAVDAGLSMAWTVSGQRMVFALATDLYARLQRLSLSFHSQRTVGDSLSRLSTDTWCVYAITEGLLISPGQQCLIIFAIGTIAWNLDRVLAVYTFAAAPLLAVSGFLFSGALKRRAQSNRAAQSRLTSFVQQTLSAIPIVQAYGTEALNRKTFERLGAAASRTSERDALVKSSFSVVNNLLTSLGAAVVLLVGGQRVMTGALSLGTFLVFIGYMRSLQSALENLLGIYGRLKSNEASMDRVLEVLEAHDEVPEAADAQPLRSIIGKPRGHLQIQNITFGYASGRPVLENVSLDIWPTEVVALVGRSGAGKTTLAALIPRLYDPWEGCIRFDGVDLKRLRLDDLRSEIAVVLQEPFLLPLTIAQNIGYGRAGADRASIVAAAMAANAHEFIERLPDKYDTVLGERGGTLSGGQRQRIAIARALVKDAPVLILDEPTSALDAHTEALVVEALQRLMLGRTTVIIAHRFSTIRHVDRLIVIDRGRIVESGTHTKLMAARGAYHALYTSQAAGPAKVAS